MRPYDVTFEKDGEKYGYQLNESAGKKMWSLTDLSLLPASMITGEASYSSYSPQKQIVTQQSDWRGGLQDLFFESLYKYYRSINTDARFKGKVILSGKVTDNNISAIVNRAIKNPNFEEWEGAIPADWTIVGKAEQATGDDAYNGDYAVKLSGGTLVHKVNDTVNIVTSHDAYDFTSLRILVNYIKIYYNAHRVSTTYHNTADTTNAVTSANAVDLATAITLANEIKADYNAHRSQTGVHVNNDTGNVVTSADASTWASCFTLANEIKADYNAHLSATLTATTGSIYRDLPFTSGTKGITVTLKARCKKSGTLTHARLYIDDGISDVTYSSEVTATSYTETTVEKTLSATATRLRIGAATEAEVENYLFIDYARNEYASLTLDECAAMKEFNSKVYFAYGKYLFQEDSAGIQVTTEFPETITALCVYQDYLLIGQGYDKHWWYSSDGWTFTENDEVYDSTPMGAKCMSNIGNSKFWFSDTENTMRDVKKPINGTGDDYTPSTQYTVGSDTYEITGLVDHEDTVFVRKQDMVYYLSGSDVINLIPKLYALVNTSVDYPLYYWGDSLYVPCGTSSLFEYNISDGMTTDISPLQFAIGDTKYDGKIRGLAGDESYLYITVETDTQALILCGHWETIDDTDWRWHPIYEVTETLSEFFPLLISNAVGGKKLYIGDYCLGGTTSPTGHTASDWVNEERAYDGDISRISGTFYPATPINSWTEYLELTHSGVACSSIGYWSNLYCETDLIDIDAYYNTGWHDVYQGANEAVGWHYHNLPASGTQTITKIRIRRYNSDNYYPCALWFYEAVLGGNAGFYNSTIILPISYVDPTSEIGYEFKSPGDFITAWYRTNFSDLDKYFQELRVTSKVRTDGDIAVYYQLKGDGDPDDDANWTLLGRCTQNDVISGNYPDEYTDIFPINKASERIRFKFTLSTTDDNYSPILSGLQLLSRITGATSTGSKIRQIDMTLKVGVSGAIASGAISHKTVAQQIKDLEMLDDSIEPLTLIGLDGVERTVLFDAVGLREEPVTIGKNRDEWTVTCTCLEAK